MPVNTPRIRPLIAIPTSLLFAAGIALAAVLLFVHQSSAGSGELFVDADDLDCTDDPGEGAGASATPFCSIQAAIDFIEETSATGGKVTLRAAEYDEAVVTNHGDFTIQGDAAVLRSAIVIRPTGEDDIGIHVTDPLGVCDNLTITHLTLDGTGHFSNRQGILVEDICEPITITDVEVSGWTEEGILFADSSGDEGTTSTDNSSISDSIVSDNGAAGIELFQGAGNVVDNVTSSGNVDQGVRLVTNTSARVLDSQLTGNGLHGVADLEGHDTVIQGNTLSDNDGHGFFSTGPYSGLRIDDNTVEDNGGAGLWFGVGLAGDGGSNTEITGNTVSGNTIDGVYVLNHSDLTVEGNSFSENGAAGVLLDDGGDAEVRGNEIEGNGTEGLHAFDYTNLVVQSNTIDGNSGHGVFLARGIDNVVSDSSMSDNTASGLRSDDAVRLRASQNDLISNDGHGFELYDGDDTLVSSNTVSNSGLPAIQTTREQGYMLAANTVVDNPVDGIRLVAGEDGRVTGNDIEDNGFEGGPEDVGLRINGETNLAVDKNTFSRNLDGQIIVNSSSDVHIQKNEIETAVDGILLIDELAHSFTGLVIGGSAANGNRFRGLDPATNTCDTPADDCYIEIPQLIVGKGTIDATFNDWGTTDPDQIEDLVCHAGESPCGSNVVDFSGALPPGDPPTEDKDETPVPPFGCADGDADGSGSVNAIDSAIILQFSAGLVGSVSCPEGADANGDGSINSLDAALVLQFTAGLLPNL